MPLYSFSVTIKAPDAHDALTVMRERLDVEEDYGFEYEIVSWVLNRRKDEGEQ